MSFLARIHAPWGARAARVHLTQDATTEMAGACLRGLAARGVRRVTLVPGPATDAAVVAVSAQMCKRLRVITELEGTSCALTSTWVDTFACFVDELVLGADTPDRVWQGWETSSVAIAGCFRARGKPVRLRTILTEETATEDFTDAVTAIRPRVWDVFGAEPQLALFGASHLHMRQHVLTINLRSKAPVAHLYIV